MVNPKVLFVGVAVADVTDVVPLPKAGGALLSVPPKLNTPLGLATALLLPAPNANAIGLLSLFSLLSAAPAAAPPNAKGVVVVAFSPKRFFWLAGAGSAAFEVAVPPNEKRFVAVDPPPAAVVVAAKPNGLGSSAAVVAATLVDDFIAFPSPLSKLPKMPGLVVSDLLAPGDAKPSPRGFDRLPNTGVGAAAAG